MSSDAAGPRVADVDLPLDDGSLRTKHGDLLRLPGELRLKGVDGGPSGLNRRSSHGWRRDGALRFGRHAR